MNLDYEENPEDADARVQQPDLKALFDLRVVGVGCAGSRIVERLCEKSPNAYEAVVINTDIRSLAGTKHARHHRFGEKTTLGLGAGGDPAMGKRAYEESREPLLKILEGAALVVLVAGLGGGTGGAVAPKLAAEIRKSGSLSIAFVTLPFKHEGARRASQATESLAELRKQCHAVICLPNDQMLADSGQSTSFAEAFQWADFWIDRGLKAISSLLYDEGLMRVDFAMLRRALSESAGKTLFALGEGRGEECVEQAIAGLEACPLMEVEENSRSGRVSQLIIHIAGGPDLTAARIDSVLERLRERFGGDELSVIGAVVDEQATGRLRITLIGFNHEAARERRKPDASAGRQELEEPPAKHKPRGSSRRGKRSRGKSKSAKAADGSQAEFLFPASQEYRGVFEGLEPNLYESEDLDIPTFERRGVKIPL